MAVNEMVEESFIEMLDQVSPLMKRTAMKVTFGNSVNAEELVADATCDLWRQWVKKPGLGFDASKSKPSSFFGLIGIRSVLRSSRMFYRKYIDLDSVVEPSHNPSETHSQLADLRLAIQRLEPEERQLVEHLLSGLHIKEFRNGKSRRTNYRKRLEIIEKLRLALGTKPPVQHILGD